MKPSKSIRFVRRLGGSLAAFLTAWAGPAAQGADLTWDNGAATGNWNGSDANFGGLWTNGNTAVFGGIAGSTININTGVSANGVIFNANNDIITASGGNTLTLASNGIVSVGSALTVTINAPLAGSAGMEVEGGGTLNLGGVSTIDGGGSGSLGLIVGSTSAGNAVNLANGGTMGTITSNRRVLTIGGSTFGNNSLVMSTPGTSSAPTFNATGNGTQPSIGVSSSNNSLTVNNGAYLAQTNGNGINTWTMGANSGANSNSILVTGNDGAGHNSTISFGSNQAMVVGAAGSNNSVTVSAGGVFNTRRWTIGTNGGTGNSVTITGAGSATSTVSTSSSSLFEMGSTAGSNSNFMSIADGGTYNFSGSGGNNRYFSIGRLGDSNYLEVTGANSALSVTFNEPVVIGGTATGTAGATLTEGGKDNHLDINTGGAVNLANTSLYVMGSTLIGNTSVNLGNGTGAATLTVGATSGGAHAGVWLENFSGRLNFNNGTLIAGAAGNLVSGAGKIELNGPATISTTYSNTISTVIEGDGSLTKGGSGTLDLTQANTYTGDTFVNNGTLKMEYAYLADAAAVQLFWGVMLDLNTSGATDKVASLWFDGVKQLEGTWGASGSGATHIDDSFFTGSGMLLVMPEPGPALLGGLGVLLVLRRRRGV